MKKNINVYLYKAFKLLYRVTLYIDRMITERIKKNLELIKKLNKL